MGKRFIAPDQVDVFGMIHKRVPVALVLVINYIIPVSFPISAFDKIKLEAPYHALTNAGHITYVELDGDPCKNLDAFERIIRCMKESGVGYGSINHPVDRDPVCGYTGIIDNECPGCKRKEAEGDEGFERIRRITGYLVGTVDRFNDAKQEEVKDRIIHKMGPTAQETTIYEAL